MTESKTPIVVGIDYDAAISRLNLPSSIPLRTVSIGELVTTSQGAVLPPREIATLDLDTIRGPQLPLLDPTIQGMVQRIAQRLQAVTIGDRFGCWQLPVYKDEKNRARYGQISNSRSPSGTTLAHRVVWEAYFGAIPEGLFLDHLCLNKSCCYPRHLEPVTHAENNRRARVSTGLSVDQLALGY